MEFIKFIFSSFWIWLGFLILMTTFLYYIVNGIVRSIQAIRGKSFRNYIGDSNNVWTDCKDKLPKENGLYYVRKDNTNAMWLCEFKNKEFTLSMFPGHKVDAIQWAEYNAFTFEDMS